jgi:hypothetical protein
MKTNLFLYILCGLLFPLALSGCASKQQTQPVQKQVQIAAVQPPPPPPTPQELAQRPYIPKSLDKAEKDPFIPLGSTGAVSSSKKSQKGQIAASGKPFVTGVLTDGETSAIIQIGARSHIVHKGETLDHFKVISISEKGVVVIGKTGRKLLPLPKLK